ncbi:MAG: hypothetical protein AAGI36_19490, partial [Pseudomonadota bacterium]
REGDKMDITLGTVLPGSRQFIRQLNVEDPQADLALDLPGEVLRCGETTMARILPYGRIVLPGGEVTRAATVTAQLEDDAAMGRALAALERDAPQTKWARMAISLSATGLSFADAVAAGEREIGGGCCDDCGHGALKPGAIRVGLSTECDAPMIWTDPAAASILIAPNDPGAYGETPENAECASLIFDCYSEWWIRGFYDKRETTCHGPCPAPQDCACRKDQNGNRFKFCKGWTFCICMN